MQTNFIDFLFTSFELHRPRLQALAHGWLGSAAQAQDAVQDTGLRHRHLASRHAEALVLAEGMDQAASSAEELAIVRDDAHTALRTLSKPEHFN